MRIGLDFTPPHESPEQWAEILEDCGFRAASFPVDYRAPVGLIDAYTKAAREHDIRIAEVGVWDSPHLSDPQRAREAQTRCLEQFRLAEYIHADCCVNVSGQQETSGFSATGKIMTRRSTPKMWSFSSACATR